jgi:uncharacterized cupredoxin-like copper-binding protein
MTITRRQLATRAVAAFHAISVAGLHTPVAAFRLTGAVSAVVTAI